MLEIKDLDWLPERNPVTNWFWRNRCWANTKDYRPRRFPSRLTRCRCSVLKDQTAHLIVIERNQAVALSKRWIGGVRFNCQRPENP